MSIQTILSTVLYIVNAYADSTVPTFQVATAGEALGMRARTMSADGYHRAALSNFTAKLTQRYNV